MKDILLAKIAVSAANVSIDKPYTYQVPEVFAEQVTPGKRVLVPFGRGNRHTEGLVLALEEQETLPPRCKSILAVLDDRPVLNREGIQLALWMRERYFCSVYEAMRAMLPAGLYFSLKDRYVIPDGVTPAAAYAAAGQSQRKRQVLDALFAHGRAMERSELYQAMGTASPAAALREKQHPAKRTFQGIRIAVNDELAAVSDVVAGAIPLLKPGGRLCVISFHSLEDRIVKQQLAKAAKGCTCPPEFPVCICGKKPQIILKPRKPILPSQEELERNPRARSAKLRVAEKVPN